MASRLDIADFREAPLTRSQFLIWTGQRLQSDEPLYNMALSFRISGELDASHFRAAFQALVDRSEALRTTFVDDGGGPRQRFHHAFPYEVALVDLSQEHDPEDALRRWQHEHAQTRFDLSRLLFESTLLKLGPADHVWFFNQHHLTTDAWSTSLIYRHVSEYYALSVQGRLSEAGELPSYSEYIEREQASPASRTGQRAKAWWEKALQTPLAPSSFYRPTPPDRRGRTERTPCPLGTRRSQRIKALARQDGFRAITDDLARFQIFATALLAWLHRLSGNTALALGTPSHSRATPRRKETIGMFIEIFPLQVSVDDGDTFASLHAKVAKAARDVFLNAPPGTSGMEHNRAYDVLLNYITASFGDFDGRAMQSEWVHSGYGDRNHLVRVQVEEFDRADEFRVAFDLNVDTFVGDERQRACRHFVRLLDAFVADPSQTLDAPDLLLDNERAALLELAEGPTAATPTTTVIREFEEQAAARGDTLAVIDGDRKLSYRDLNSAADDLAARLAAGGACAGTRIALALPRSADAIIAILAVLKTGAAYVPLDPDYPRERIAFMLRDSGALRVLTLSTLTDRLPPDAEVLCLDESPQAQRAATAAPTLADAAYVIYTSGSTGRPKGVEVGHDNLAQYIAWADRQYQRGEALHWAMFSSLSFDLTVTSTFVPLTSGGSIVVYREPAERGDLTIRRVVEDNAVDVVKLTPAHLALIQPMDLSASKLRKLILGGEDLKTDLARSISKYFGDRIELYNEYGPTEATVACMIHRFDPEADTQTSVPIGRPIDNALIYVLDEGGRLAPRGVAGEIFIGGPGVARGYLGRQSLTAERFPDNPFRPGEKMYRTGDLARWRDDGTLAYLGRCDFQIKVGGVRIEPGEIEATLVAHPSVSEAAVRLVERAKGAQDDDRFCQRCGISARHPKAHLDDEDVCRICRVYEDERDKAMAYFGDMDDLREIAAGIQREVSGTPDCMMLLSGGKDSTYALCQIVDLGLTPLVLTLDNGFISEGAKANVRRVVDQLGLELVIGETPAMNAIFADSLRRFSNVCNGCFKTIYTLAVNLARERGIRHIFTGLSRGQIFETRVADQFHQRIFDPVRIDANIIEARKAYHRADDEVSRSLDVSAFRSDAVFDEIKYVDFYRYADVSLDEMYEYLGSRVPWVRPADTGRSTNCLINEAGIYVHKKERGYHNYSLPYSWDVRLGHKERDAAREELDDDIDVDNVQRILREVGYEMDEQAVAARRLLTGWYVAPESLPAEDVKAFLAERLPSEYVPTHYVHLTAMPLTANGKVDVRALPEPDAARPQLAQSFAAPSGSVETVLAEVWADVLGIDRVGVNDNFFDLGGDSILNIQIVSRARKFGLTLSPQQVFDHPTIAELARVAGNAADVVSEQGAVTGPVGLTPIQKRFFELDLDDRSHYNQAVVVDMGGRPDALVVEEALRQILRHHDALRSGFVRDGDSWHQEILEPAAVGVSLASVDLAELGQDERKSALERHASSLHDSMNLGDGTLLAAALFDFGPAEPAQLMIAVHHLVIDGVSWWILLDDLEHACEQLAAGRAVRMPAKTSSVRRWHEALQRYANAPDTLATLSYWRDANPSATPLPLDTHKRDDNDLASVRTVSVSLSRERTSALLTEVAAAWRTQPPDLIVAALTDALCEWSGHKSMQIDLEGHGREDIAEGLDLLRTVGWFTSIYPLTIDAGNADRSQRVRAVRDRLHGVPQRGIAAGALRYLCDDAAVRAAMAALPAPDVLFNYLGQWDKARAGDAALTLARPISASFGPGGRRSYLLEVNAVIFGGRLRIDWTYGACHGEATVRELADKMRAALEAYIDHCRSTADSQLTPEHFPDADLSQDDLDDILSDFGEDD